MNFITSTPHAGIEFRLERNTIEFATWNRNAFCGNRAALLKYEGLHLRL